MQIHITLADGTPLRTALYEQLRQAILDGRIRPGEALRASRELARQLDISRSTVAVVYERLAGEGFLVSRRGAGTFVSDALVSPTKTRRRAAGSAVLTARPVWESIPLSRAFADDVRYDYRTGLPDAGAVPASRLAAPGRERIALGILRFGRVRAPGRSRHAPRSPCPPPRVCRPACAQRPRTS